MGSSAVWVQAGVWSPVGAWLVFVRWQPDGSAGPAAAGLWAIHPDGSHLQQLGAAIGSATAVNEVGANNYRSGSGYYGSFGWDQRYAIAPKPDGVTAG